MKARNSSFPPLTTAEAMADAFDVSRETTETLDRFVRLLKQWNQAACLVGSATVPAIWSRHVADSLQLLRYIPQRTRILLDIGSGGGIPGVILAIALADRPRLKVHLVESNQRKCAFLREAVRLLSIPAELHAARVENITIDDLSGHPDIVCARALAPLPRLFELTARFIRGGAIGVFPKGRHLGRELRQAAQFWTIDAQSCASAVEPSGFVLIVRGLARV